MTMTDDPTDTATAPAPPGSTLSLEILRVPRLFLNSHRARRVRPLSRRSAVSSSAEESPILWEGEDQFTPLNDRSSDPPLRLPAIDQNKRMVLVRHGQSTWNAAGRLQGSTDFAVLTDKGVAQAKMTRKMLEGEQFDRMYRSPLARAYKTGEIVWADRTGEVIDNPSLREVDLYSMQGLLKHEGKERFGEQYLKWQKDPANFEMDQHFPVRELWYRGSLCWQEILKNPANRQCLVVAHNAINQGLLNTALGLPPSFFRCFIQNNAAVTVVDFRPDGDGPPRATLERMNSAPSSPFKAGGGVSTQKRMILVRHGATDLTEGSRIQGPQSEAAALSTLGRVQARKTAELLVDAPIGRILHSASERAAQTAEEIALLQPLGGHPCPSLESLGHLRTWHPGDWEGLPYTEAREREVPENAEPVGKLWERAGSAFDEAMEALDRHAQDGAVVLVADDAVLSAFVAKAIHLGEDAMRFFRLDTGSVSVLDFPDGTEGRAAVRTTNYTAHFGRWAVPITGEGTYDSCGIDSCW